MTDIEEAPSIGPELITLVLDRPTGRYIHIHRAEEGEGQTPASCSMV
ncbi:MULTISPECIES: hypothetical protein [Streptomyces]|nr:MULTISPECIES: hypothetical protein [Streptomyces]